MEVVDSIFNFLPSRALQREGEGANEFLGQLIDLAACSDRMSYMREASPTPYYNIICIYQIAYILYFLPEAVLYSVVTVVELPVLLFTHRDT